MSFIASLGIITNNNYKTREIEIYELYYLNNYNVLQISKYFKTDKETIINILSDPYYNELQKIFKRAVQDGKKKN